MTEIAALIKTLRAAGDHDRNPETGAGPLTFCHEAADALEALAETVTGGVEWGVQTGTWPPQEYQSLDTARFYVDRPFKGEEGYDRKVVTRRTYSTPWVEVTS